MSRSAIAAIAVLALAHVPPAVAAPRPGVRIADRDPLTLAGRGFKPRERVKLTVELGASTEARRVRASAAGTFETAFTAMTLRRCHGGLTLTAAGSEGSRVHWKLLSLHCAKMD